MWTSICICVVSSLKWTNECRLAYPGKIFADAPACITCVYNLTSALYLCYSSTFCSSLSVSVSLNVRFTTNGACSKTYNHIYVARTDEDLSPYICNVCEFSGTNYCMPTRWLTGPLQKIPPLAQTSGYATDCGGRHFSTRPGAALTHVGSLVLRRVCESSAFSLPSSYLPRKECWKYISTYVDCLTLIFWFEPKSTGMIRYAMHVRYFLSLYQQARKTFEHPLCKTYLCTCTNRYISPLIVLTQIQKYMQCQLLNL